MDNNVTSITTDYAQFSYFDCNRSVHVIKKLKESLKEIGQISPVICDANLRVIDGQHRIAALKDLNKPVWYIVLNDVTDGAIAEVNSTQKSWRFTDYFNYWVRKKSPEYLQLASFGQEVGLDPMAVQPLIINNGYTRDIFKKGDYVHDRPTLLRRVHILNYFNFFPEYKKPIFIQAVVAMLSAPNFDEKRLVLALERCSGDLLKATKMGRYKKQLEEIYNHGLKGKNRITLT